MPLLRRSCPSLHLLLWLALSVGCTTDTTPESAQWGQGLEVAPPVLSAAALGADGLIHLAIFQGSAFAFTIKGPAAGIVVGQEIDVTNTPGWQVGFTAMVPGTQELPDNVPTCNATVDEAEEDEAGCQVPYVGYGEYVPVPMIIEAGIADSSAQLYFHEFGSKTGDRVQVDVIYSLSRSDEDDGCQVYHRYTTAPLSFIMEAPLGEAEPVLAASPVAGPIFPLDITGGNDGLYLDAFAPACALTEMPLPYRNFCPLPGSAEGAGPPVGTWHWYHRCLSGTNQSEPAVGQ